MYVASNASNVWNEVNRSERNEIHKKQVQTQLHRALVSLAVSRLSRLTPYPPLGRHFPVPLFDQNNDCYVLIDSDDGQ